MNGVINFLKPPGMSSNGAVVFLRGLLGVKKTGHAGTLDPGACGVLPICVGKATKISSYLMGGKKEYIAELTFGRSMDTGDSYGEVAEVSIAAMPSALDVQGILHEFCGNIQQQTPAYSAVKHEGRKLYDLARKGIETPIKYRDIQIHEIEYLHQTREGAHLIRVVCGKGTYIRTLCEDIAKRLGTLGYMSFLARSQCAGLDINNAITADEIRGIEDRSSILMPIDGFLQYLPSVSVKPSRRRILFNGGDSYFKGEDQNEVRVHVDGELLGIGSIQNNNLKITTLLVDK